MLNHAFKYYHMLRVSTLFTLFSACTTTHSSATILTHSLRDKFLEYFLRRNTPNLLASLELDSVSTGISISRYGIIEVRTVAQTDRRHSRGIIAF